MLCPKCGKPLFTDKNSYKCEDNHCYDIAKEGYVNLLLSRTDSGDDKTLVNGRINFLSKGYYVNLRTFLEKIISDFSQNKEIKLLDMGCGTGYYTQNFANLATTFGIDISKNAIKYAAKHDKKSLYIVGSNKRTPFCDNYFDILVHIFSPNFENEDLRVLKKGGIIINVEPGPKHLIELKNLLYKKAYFNEEKNHFYTHLKIKDKKSLIYQVKIDDNDIHNLIMMTPYFYKTKKEDLQALKLNHKMDLTIDFSITIFEADF